MPLDPQRFVDYLPETLQFPYRVKPRIDIAKTSRFRQPLYLTATFGKRVVTFENPFPLEKVKAEPVTLDPISSWLSREEAVRAYLTSFQKFFDSKTFLLVLGDVEALKAALEKELPQHANRLASVRVRLVLRCENLYESRADELIALHEFGLLASQYVALWGKSQTFSNNGPRFFI